MTEETLRVKVEDATLYVHYTVGDGIDNIYVTGEMDARRDRRTGLMDPILNGRSLTMTEAEIKLGNEMQKLGVSLVEYIEDHRECGHAEAR